MSSSYKDNMLQIYSSSHLRIRVSCLGSPYKCQHSKLESVQRRAARFCSGDFSRYSSVTSMLLLLDLPSLEFRQKLAKFTTMYKLINGNLHIPSNSLIPNHHDSRDRYFMQLQCRTDSYKFSFFPPPLSYGIPSPSIINSANLS